MTIKNTHADWDEKLSRIPNVEWYWGQTDEGFWHISSVLSPESICSIPEIESWPPDTESDRSRFLSHDSRTAYPELAALVDARNDIPRPIVRPPEERLDLSRLPWRTCTAEQATTSHAPLESREPFNGHELTDEELAEAGREAIERDRDAEVRRYAKAHTQTELVGVVCRMAKMARLADEALRQIDPSPVGSMRNGPLRVAKVNAFLAMMCPRADVLNGRELFPDTGEPGCSRCQHYRPAQEPTPLLSGFCMTLPRALNKPERRPSWCPGWAPKDNKD